jgi:hypothetical protein
MVQVRYVGYKMKMFDSIPVSLSDAYSGSPKSRISHHNDCFVSSDNDVGSYKYIVFEKNYLEQDSKFTSTGGETCALYETRSNCDTSVYEMERFHWSFINQDYYGPILNQWVANGCYTLMQKKLGYRYFLTSSQIQDSARPSGSFEMSFTLTNMGFSNPINPRNVKIILKNKITGDEFFVFLNTEIRKKELNTPFVLDATLGIPSWIPEGDYAVCLQLPDPRATLSGDPKFSIRLANKTLWDGATGYHTLNHTLHISRHYTQGNESSDNYFRPEISSSFSPFQIDGVQNEWSAVPLADSVTSNAHLKKCKFTDFGDSLYFLLTGENLYENTQIFIDSDRNSATGMNYWTWADDSGVDYLIQNNQLFKYTGSPGGNGWDWQLLSEIPFSGNSSVVEIAVPKNKFTAVSLQDSFLFGTRTVTADWQTGEPLPLAGQDMLIAGMGKTIHSPHIKLSGYCQNALFTFMPEKEDTSSLIVIEKSKDQSGPFSGIAVMAEKGERVSFSDNGLATGSSYYYRAYRIKESSRSSASEPLSVTPANCTFNFPVIDLNQGDEAWSAIAPIGAGRQSDRNYFIKVYCSRDYADFLIHGDSISQVVVYLDTDNNMLTGQVLPGYGNAGFDYKITTGQVFKYQTGSFVPLATVDSVKINTDLVVLKIPLSLFENADQITSFRLIAEISGNTFSLPVPYSGWPVYYYERTMPSSLPANLAIRRSVSTPGSKLIVTWDKCSDCKGYILTRKNQSTGAETDIYLLPNDNQLIDGGLSADTWYEYTVCSYNFSGKSELAGPVTLNTTTGILTTENENSFLLFPDPANDVINIRIPGYLNEPLVISMYTVDGREIFRKNCNPLTSADDADIQIQTGSYERGMYIIVIRSAANVYQQKVFLI